MTATAEKVFFTVTGEFVTDHVRDRMLDQGWESALRFLDLSLPDLPIDDAISILKGKKKLVGVNKFCLEDDDPTSVETRRYLTHLAYKYAGVWLDPGKNECFRPYAYVGSFGPDDLVGPLRQNVYDNKWQKQADVPQGRTDGTWRGLAYANDARNDRATYENCDDKHGYEGLRVILWEQVHHPPFWWPTCHKSVDAMQEFMDANLELEDRGYHRRYDDWDVDIPDNFVDVEGDDDPDTQNVIRRGLAEDLINNTGGMIDAASATAMVDNLFGDVDESEPDADKELVHSYGWISPNGVMYGCHYAQHKQMAIRIMSHIIEDEKYFGIDWWDSDSDADKTLDELGWMKLTRSALDGQHSCGVRNKATKGQVRTMERWMDKHNTIVEIEELKV